MFAVADELDYTRPLLVNLDFSLLTANKSIAKTRAGSVSFTDMERLEKCSHSLLEGNLHALWLMSALVSQLKADGFSPSDLTLSYKAISLISCTLASQTSLAAAMSDFVVSKRKESLLSHVSLPISASQKRELLVTPGTDSALFDQLLLEQVSGQVKEDSFISTSMAMAKLAGAKSGGKTKSSASYASSSFAGGSSPLGFSRPGPSGFCKLSTSPARGRGGRGTSPSLSSRRKGFRKQESYPCPLTVGGCLSLHWQAWSDRGADPWVVEVLRRGYQIPFHSAPPLSSEPIPFPAYTPSSIWGKALEQEVLSLVEKGAVELAPRPSPGFYCRLFVVMKASESWRPMIDFSTLNLHVLKSPFKMETLQSVLFSVRSEDWMVSLDL